jgi:hypothetical protein
MNWALIVENMPGAKWLVTLRRASEIVAEQEVLLADTLATDGLLIGTVQPVHVLLPSDAGIPPTRIRVIGGGNHTFVSVLEGVVEDCGRPVTGECFRRFDWRTLYFGSYAVHLDVQE